MAIRARLTAPRETREEWPWHDVESTSLPASLLFSGDRRMEAENFLAPGFAIRHAITTKRTGWTTLSEVARTWQPSRLKGIQVSPDFGTPFLAATQVFDVRPVPRKWLSLNRTSDYEQRYVQEGTILLTCSGSVGRATLADETIADMLISHDLLRIEPNEQVMRGWVYAYLRSPTIRAMMASAQYGHMIKHLETSHLDALPFVFPEKELLDRFNDQAERIIQYRNQSHQLTHAAEAAFETAFGSFSSEEPGEAGFAVTASGAFFSERRRFEAQFHNPAARQITSHLDHGAVDWATIRELGFNVWLPTRFRRVNAEDGIPFMDSSVLFEINPDLKKFIRDNDFGDPHNARVRAGWLLLARSGQVYGLNGSTMIAGHEHEGKIISDHVIRIAPQNPAVRVGYLHVAMSHPTLGRPRVKALPYGSSIPEIEVADVLELRIPRLAPDVEAEIADKAEEAARLRDEADLLEIELANEADEIVRHFIQ